MRQPSFLAGMPTVGVISATRLSRSALASALISVGSYRIVDLGGGGPPSMEIVRQESPDVIVVDLPERELLRFAESIMQTCPAVKVVGVNAEPDEPSILRLFTGGLAGVVSKDGTFEEIGAVAKELLDHGVTGSHASARRAEPEPPSSQVLAEGTTRQSRAR